VSVTRTPHRVTGADTLLAACDACPEAMYVPAQAQYEMREAVTYLGHLGWRIDGPSYAPTRTICPNHQETHVHTPPPEEARRGA